MKSPFLRHLMASLLLFTAALTRADDPVPFSPASRWEPAGLSGGTVTKAGRSGNAIVLSGTGLGIMGSASKAAILHRTHDTSAYASVTARIVSLEGAGGTGEAGLWLVCPPSSPFENFGVRMVYRPDGTLRWEATTFSNGYDPGTTVSSLSLPLWLRIEWHGGGLTGEYSSDGFAWQQLTSSLPITLPGTARPGLLVSSGGSAQEANAVFDNVWVWSGDADDNGIFDGWEMKHFQRLLGADAAADPDQDGNSNLSEWLWQTNPKVHDRPPALKIETRPGGNLFLSMPVSGSGGIYKIEGAAGPDGPWTVLNTAYETPGELSVTVTNSEPRRFFRGLVSGYPREPFPGFP